MADLPAALQDERDAEQNLLRRHPVVTFYLLAFLIAWTGYMPVLAASRGVTFFRSPLWLVFLVLPAAGPALAAWIAGPTGTGGLLLLRASLFRRVPWGWWMFAVLAPLAMSLCADSLSLWFAPARSPDLPPAPPPGVLVAVVTSLCANLWEEVGWRGFVLTHLQTKYDGRRAALIIGVMSALWHIPLFFWTGGPMSRVPFLAWAPGVVGESLVLAWLFNRTRRSLAVVALFHIAFNIFGAALGVRSHGATSVVEIGLGLVLALSAGPRLGLQKAETQASTSP
ncbi:type II CAAX endopeptidase family protein [Granulicella sibirica]|uniref:CAAX amino terminal protease family protein n=1 Tax=Granulicella sibirica TaxID=2479048 RepID=A0A4Q0T4V4_9BACT|nr:type II CAAX endopeptidase family protein [Granulicella sibirica]RXH57620.1 CAAX amino terminal protease family protein [Granulicella sibirica]